MKAIEITIKFLNFDVLLFFLKKDHFPFKIEDFNLHHNEYYRIVCTGMITIIENLILKIKQKRFPLTLNVKFRAYLSDGHDENSSVCFLSSRLNPKNS